MKYDFAARGATTVFPWKRTVTFRARRTSRRGTLNVTRER